MNQKSKNFTLARVSTISALALSLGTVSGAALAAESGFYLSADVGKSHNNLSNSSTASLGTGTLATDKRGNVYGLSGGYQFNKHFATELSVQRLGTQGIGSSKAKTTAYSLDAIARLPVSDKIAVYGRLGASHLDRKFSGIEAQDKHGVGFKLGLGAEYALSSKLSLRTELSRYNNAPAISGYGDRMKTWTAGVKYNF